MLTLVRLSYRTMGCEHPALLSRLSRGMAHNGKAQRSLTLFSVVFCRRVKGSLVSLDNFTTTNHVASFRVGLSPRAGKLLPQNNPFACPEISGCAHCGMEAKAAAKFINNFGFLEEGVGLLCSSNIKTSN